MSIQDRQEKAEKLIFEAFPDNEINRTDVGPLMRRYHIRRKEPTEGEGLIGQIEMDTTKLLKEEPESVGRHVSDQIKHLKRTLGNSL